jgi:hypothetical protein
LVTELTSDEGTHIFELLKYGKEGHAEGTEKGASYILWDVDPLLGNNRERKNWTTAVTRQRPVKSTGGTVFSVRPVPICYKQES